MTYRDEKQERNTALFKRCAFKGENGRYSRDNHWKGPVRVVVEEDEAGVDSVKLLGDGLVRIESKGYYHHIGA
jgi:hypothetical protein